MVGKKKDICPVCGGTGQVSFFQGVSRFLLTAEECPGCAGTGFILDEAGEQEEQPMPDGKMNGRRNR